MRATRFRVAVTVLALIVVALPRPAAAENNAVMVGEAVVDAVDRLRAAGLPVIYTSRLLPRSLRVGAVPESADPRQALRELLRPHGLTIREEGRYLVVVRARDADDATGRQAGDAATGRVAIDEVVVSASRYALDRETDLFRFDARQGDILALPDVGDDVLKYVQRLPGAASNGVTARTHLRGGLQDEVDVVLNGYRLRDPFHVRDFQSPFSIIDSRAVGSMQVYSGGFPARYGERMSGLVVIDSLQPAAPVRHEIGVSVYDTSVLSSGYFDDGRGHWLASARRGNLDLFIDDAFGSPRYADAFAVAQYELNERVSLGINALLADDAVDVFVENSSDELVRSNDDARSRQLWINGEVRLTPKIAVTGVLAAESSDRERLGRNLQEGKIDARVDDTRRTRAWSLRQDWRVDATPSRQWRFGAGYERTRSSYRYDATARYDAEWLAWASIVGADLDRAARVDARGETLFAYGSLIQRFGSSTVAEVGLRWDKQTYTDIRDDSEWSPRVSVLRRIGDDWELRASFGRYHQAQRLDELDVADGDTRFYPTQRTDQYILGAQRHFGDALVARVELYYKYSNRLKPRYENLLDPTQVTPELAPDRARIAPQTARAWGTELLIERRGDALDWWFSAALARAEDRLPGVGWAERSWDQRRALNAGMQWRHGPWTLSAAYSRRSGWPITPVRLDTASGDAIVRFGEYNTDRLGGFSSLNLRAARRFDVSVGELDVFFEFSNVTDERNVCCRDYDVETTDAGALELDVSEDAWLGIFPAAGVLWRF